jgi:hypothetical protein
MNSKLTLNLKKKLSSTKTKNIKQKHQCPCISSFLSILKDKMKVQRFKISEKETHNPEIVQKSSGKSSVLKVDRESHIIRIPKIGCDIPYLVTLFTNLSNTGAVRMGERGIMNAVNIAAKAKKDLDEGKQWNGNIEIAENLKLKLYKSGLVLYQKNKKFV